MKTIIPKYLTSGKNTAWLVCGTALFALLFIIIFKPFDSYDWVDGNFWLFTIYSLLAVLTGMFVIAVSRTVMHFYNKKKDIGPLDYSIWLVSELTFMVFFLTILAIIFGKQNTWQDFESIFGRAIIYSTLILLIPYTIFTLGFMLREKSERLHLLEQANEESIGTQKISGDELLNFRDEKGELKLSIRANSLYYIEAADNYVTLHFKNANKMQRYLLRNSLKRIEGEFMERDLIRCHRSYIVNFNKIQLLQKTDGGLILDFGEEKVQTIPVSKTYSKQLLLRFTEELKN